MFVGSSSPTAYSARITQDVTTHYQIYLPSYEEKGKEWPWFSSSTEPASAGRPSIW